MANDTTNKKKPTWSIKTGTVKTSLWENEGKYGKMYNHRQQKNIAPRGTNTEWKKTDYFDTLKELDIQIWQLQQLRQHYYEQLHNKRRNNTDTNDE